MAFIDYHSENPDFLNNYLMYKRYILSSSQASVDSIYFDLRTFLRYVRFKLYNEDKLDNITIEEFQNTPIYDVTLNDLNQVGREMLVGFVFFVNIKLNNSAKTSNRKVSSLKGFFEYLSDNRLIDSNPTIYLDKARTPKREAKCFSLKESKQLLSNTIKSESRNKLRNYAIMCLFLNCGIRLSELVLIDLNDIKMDERTLRVHGKGEKERVVYLNNACIEVITEYLKIRPTLEITNKDRNALFISERNKRISRRSVQDIITNEIGTTFGDTKDGYHTHTLRHSCASMLYNENDTNILIIKKILGHSCLSSCEIYTHINDKKMKFIMDNFSISSLLERNNNDI